MIDYSCMYPAEPGRYLVGTSWYVRQMHRAAAHRHIHHGDWVFDYSYTHGGMTRAGSERAPWQERPARCGHLYPPECPYWEDATRDGMRIQGGWVIFRDNPAFGLTELIRPEYGYVRFLDPEGLAAELLEDIGKSGASGGPDAYWRAFGGFCRMVDLLLHSRPGEREIRVLGESARIDSFAERVRSHFRLHLGETVRLGDVATALRVSESTLSHRFQEETGQSPMQALLGLRIDAAKALILRGERLESIARQTGFTDAFHFSRTFKRLTGMPPKTYRARCADGHVAV